MNGVSHQALPWPRDAADRIFPALFVVLWSTGSSARTLGLPYAEPATFLSFALGWYSLSCCRCAGFQGHTWRGAWGLAIWRWQAPAHRPAYLWGVFASIITAMPAGVAALITGLQPVFIGCWRIGLGERASRAGQWAGLALGLGALLVVGDRIAVGRPGDAAILLSVLALASINLGTYGQKRHGGRSICAPELLCSSLPHH